MSSTVTSATIIPHVQDERSVTKKGRSFAKAAARRGGHVGKNRSIMTRRPPCRPVHARRTANGGRRGALKRWPLAEASLDGLPSKPSCSNVLRSTTRRSFSAARGGAASERPALWLRGRGRPLARGLACPSRSPPKRRARAGRTVGDCAHVRAVYRRVRTEGDELAARACGKWRRSCTPRREVAALHGQGPAVPVARSACGRQRGAPSLVRTCSRMKAESTRSTSGPRTSCTSTRSSSLGGGGGSRLAAADAPILGMSSSTFQRANTGEVSITRAHAHVLASAQHTHPAVEGVLVDDACDVVLAALLLGLGRGGGGVAEGASAADQAVRGRLDRHSGRQLRAPRPNFAHLVPRPGAAGSGRCLFRLNVVGHGVKPLLASPRGAAGDNSTRGSKPEPRATIM